MNKRSIKPRSLQTLYSELIFIIPFCILTAHLFVGFRQKENYLEIILKRGYLLAMVVSTLIAFLLIIYIKYVTRYFAKQPPRFKWSNWFFQIVFCFLLAIVLEFMCSAAYFWCRNVDISDTAYFDSYLLPIILFIMMVNVWYADGFVTLNYQVTDQVMVEVAKIEEETFKQDSKSTNIAENAKTDQVVYITITEGVHYAYDIWKQPVWWFENITDSMKKLPAADYFLVGRRHILHRAIIDKLDADPIKRKLTLSLKEPFDETIEVPQKSILAFNEWWNKA